MYRSEELLEHILDELIEIRRELKPKPRLATGITFKEITMLPTTGGNTLVFTGTLSPDGATMLADATFTVNSNDPSVVPTVDATGLIVTVPLPAGWVESTTAPLAIGYTAASASNPSWSLTAIIQPSAPPVLPTGITFVQTT
jgi:uncharacterized protein YjdB